MAESNTIDFTREDFGGEWLLFVCFALFALTTIKKTELVGGGWRKAWRVILKHVLIGALVATPVVLLMAVWMRLPRHQYFVNLRLESDRVVLGYRWPEPEVAIPLKEVTTVSTIHEVRFRRSRSCYRVRIDTPSESLRSFGFDRLNDDEQLVWEKLESAVEEQHQPRIRHGIRTNAPDSTSLP